MRDLFEKLGLRLPIWNAGMGGLIAGPPLVASVAEAGGLGVLGIGGIPTNLVTPAIETTRRTTTRAFGANIILPMSDGADIEACFDAQVAVLILFWGDPQPFVKDAHKRNMFIVAQVGSSDEASEAADAGADAVILQGIEAGGHVKAVNPLRETLSQTVSALGSTPVIAAGGVATGADIADALNNGALAVSLGTRFVASTEAGAFPDYKGRIIKARASDTVLTKLFDIGWSEAPHRVIRTGIVDRWEKNGRPQSGQRSGEGEQIGTIQLGEQSMPLPRYSVMPPLEHFDGDLESLPLYAGKSVERIDDIKPVTRIIERLMIELKTALIE